MKKNLKKSSPVLYYFKDYKKIDGANSTMSGYCGSLFGNCSGLSGDCSNLFGNCTLLSGDCTGLRGDCTGILGNLDNCEITYEERSNGINISDLVGG